MKQYSFCCSHSKEKLTRNSFSDRFISFIYFEVETYTQRWSLEHISIYWVVVAECKLSEKQIHFTVGFYSVFVWMHPRRINSFASAPHQFDCDWYLVTHENSVLISNKAMWLQKLMKRIPTRRSAMTLLYECVWKSAIPVFLLKFQRHLFIHCAYLFIRAFRALIGYLFKIVSSSKNSIYNSPLPFRFTTIFFCNFTHRNRNKHLSLSILQLYFYFTT